MVVVECVTSSSPDENVQGSFRNIIKKYENDPIGDLLKIKFDVDRVYNKVIEKININNLVINGKGNMTFIGKGLIVRGSDVVLKNFRIHLDPTLFSEDELDKGDALCIGDTKQVYKNVTIKNLSLFWSIDEIISVVNCDNVKIVNCFFAEPLNDTGHKNEHSFVFLPRLESGQTVTMANNLFCFFRTRGPKLGGSGNFHFSNNYIYNWYGDKPGYTSDDGDGSFINFVGNYYQAGPMSERNSDLMDVKMEGITFHLKDNLFEDQNGNKSEMRPSGQKYKLESSMIRFNSSYQQIFADRLIPAKDVPTDVLNNSGCLPRDKNDERLITLIKNRGGQVLLDEPPIKL